jgi:hypothetical protein
MPDIPQEIKRRMVAEALHARDAAFFVQRVDRYVEISHQPVTPYHHFSKASAECIDLYTDGHFISTVMVAQSVAEGISKFVAERNGIHFTKRTNASHLVNRLAKLGIVSRQYKEAVSRLWERRDDVHHMKPDIGSIHFAELARGSIQDLAVIEREIFDCGLVNGAFSPVNRKYWDIGPDGRAPVFLRCDP